MPHLLVTILIDMLSSLVSNVALSESFVQLPIFCNFDFPSSLDVVHDHEGRGRWANFLVVEKDVIAKVIEKIGWH
jgi:hypothetical protein